MKCTEDLLEAIWLLIDLADDLTRGPQQTLYRAAVYLAQQRPGLEEVRHDA